MDTQQTQAVDGAALAWAFRKFVAAFPASFPDERAIEEKVDLWRELLEQHPSVSPAAFRTAVYELVWKHGGDFLPTPAQALDFFQAAQAAVEREAQKALPPPAPVTQSAWERRSGPERVAFFERHVALGKLRARAGVSLASFDGQMIPFDPPEHEIQAELERMRRTGFLRKTLERIAARDEAPLADIGQVLTGRWPGAAD